jgi:hypothetical protein
MHWQAAEDVEIEILMSEGLCEFDHMLQQTLPRVTEIENILK